MAEIIANEGGGKKGHGKRRAKKTFHAYRYDAQGRLNEFVDYIFHVDNSIQQA
jgi:hypothetical protein